MEPLDAAYIAGFFDGEGHVQAYREPYNIRFAQNDKTVLEWIQTRCGGRIYKSRTTNCHNLVINGLQARPVLEELMPYLKVKRLEAEMYLIYVLPRISL